VGAGQTASFSVIATGTSPSYQWKKNGADIPGATSSTYTTPTTSSADNGAEFTVEVRNSAGTVISSAAGLKVGLGITTQPADQTVAPGNTATFSVTASGIGTVRYQWKKRGGVIAGATSSSYTTPATDQVFDTGAVFTVVVTDDEGTVTSSNATLTVSRFSLVANASAGGTYDLTECVKDNRTGLVWEGKNPDGSSTRPGDGTYTNYDNTPGRQTPDDTQPTPEQINASTNSIGYRNAVNASSLCGFTDWRLPTVDELKGISLGEKKPAEAPSIDTTWFPNTQLVSGYAYWSSDPYISDSRYVYNFEFRTGYRGETVRKGQYAVRLVRSSQ
ncbi:MAG: DUF1566 domain-containing protein, partial [Rhodoferax sp.]|nr:DUF1566 domain-containing protein [Rhodoferax sp.]